MKTDLYKIVVSAPGKDGGKIREALAEAGTGHIGAYDYCSASVRVVGRFRPLKGSKPHIGKIGKIGKVIEERIETVCPENKLKSVIKAIRAAHPYQEPVIDIYPLVDWKKIV